MWYQFLYLIFFSLLSVCRIDAFLKSDQNRTASRLLTAYNEGDIEEIKKVACSSTVNNLDHAVIHWNDLPNPLILSEIIYISWLLLNQKSVESFH